jgi:hypothetical protein
MKPYVGVDRAPLPAVGVLVVSALTAGAAVGTLAYFLGGFLYIPLLFWLGLAFVTIPVFTKVMDFARIRHRTLCRLVGLLMGITTVLAFHFTAYRVARNAWVSSAVRNHHADPAVANTILDKLLRETTGVPGFPGYLIAHAKAGEAHSLQLLYRFMPVEDVTFTLGTTLVWINWIFGLVVVSATLAWFGYRLGARDLSTSDHRWYGGESWVGDVGLGSRDEFLTSLERCDPRVIGSLVTPKAQIAHRQHPVLEVLVQCTSAGDTGSALLVVNQTRRNELGTISRVRVGRWELSPAEYATFLQETSLIDDEHVHWRGMAEHGA